ncbi:MAG: SPOR domain-containing protein [Magnetococcales bacterium]|nr:SPOR domain-containing protein [Magnetococcales bacterium]
MVSSSQKKQDIAFQPMETSANREQQLFLIMGGVVLTLIIGVVIFDVLERSGGDTMTEETRPVVRNAAPDAREGKTAKWIDAMAPAPVFVAPSTPPAAAPAPTSSAAPASGATPAAAPATTPAAATPAAAATPTETAAATTPAVAASPAKPSAPMATTATAPTKTPAAAVAPARTPVAATPEKSTAPVAVAVPEGPAPAAAISDALTPMPDSVAAVASTAARTTPPESRPAPEGDTAAAHEEQPAMGPALAAGFPASGPKPSGRAATEPKQWVEPLDTWSPNAASLEAARHALRPDEQPDPADQAEGTYHFRGAVMPGAFSAALGQARHDAGGETHSSEVADLPAPGVLLKNTVRLTAASFNAPPISTEDWFTAAATPLRTVAVLPPPQAHPTPSAPRRAAVAKPVQPTDDNQEYWVKLATFSNEGNAQALFQTLSTLSLDGKKLPVSRSDAPSGNKIFYRIRVGPFTDRAQAERTVQLLQQQVDITGTVVFLKK